MFIADPDVIDALAEIDPGSPLDRIRARRPRERQDAQARYRALFQPGAEDGMSSEERHAVAAFVAGLHREPAIMRFYRRSLADPDGRWAETISQEVFLGVVRGPYGRYPAGPLSAEAQEGRVHRVLDAHRPLLGRRLAAAFEHAHLLVFHPRDASPAALEALREAGWSPAGIETLSRLVAFLAYQVRVVSGLRVLDAA